MTGAAYTYDLFNQLATAAENGLIAAYAYNVQGIRTCKATATRQTYFLLDGGNVVGEHTGSETVTYLRGANLISRSDGSKITYYLFNAHGDVTDLVSDSGMVTHKYDYDAFGVEKKPDPLDGNPFRYCGEYYDGETKTYYLRARYYDPNIGRFTQQDTHWTTANSIYGDNPRKINEREDKLGLKSYSYAPQITAVMQSGNLYVYGVNNPVAYVDWDGNLALEILALILLGGLATLGTAALSKAFQTLRKSLGDVLTSLAQQMSANIAAAKKQSDERAAFEAAQRAATQSAPAAPQMPDPDDQHSSSKTSKNFKKYNSREIERRYGLKNKQYHREIKEHILRDLSSDSRYRSLLKSIGNNPDIYLSADGQIQIVSTSEAGSPLSQTFIFFIIFENTTRYNTICHTK